MLLTMLGVAPHMLHLCADLMPLMVSTTLPLALVIYTIYLHATIFSSSLSAAVWSSIVFLSCSASDRVPLTKFFAADAGGITKGSLAYRTRQGFGLVVTSFSRTRDVTTTWHSP